jgi:hypothetical protein
MAHPRTAATAPRGAARIHVIAPVALGETAVAALRARGLDAIVAASRADAGQLPADDVLAIALEATPTAAAAVELADICARAASRGRPVCVFAPPPTGSGRVAIERTAALAYVRAHGAALAHDIDVWLEAAVVVARHGVPAGPRAAVIAPPGSWLEAQAQGLIADAEAAGLRSPIAELRGDEPADVVLFDAALAAPAAGVDPAIRALPIAVAARGELADGGAALLGLRAALGAVAIVGRAAERIAVGVGPAPASAAAELETNDAQLQRQLGKLRGPQRVGDHEAKVLLSAYGVPITRQAVATTPSAAVKLAKRAGFPVELKPWGADLPTEPAGCPVEKDVTSAALVRRAFSAVLAAAGRATADASGEGGGVIVRAAPPVGRDVAVSIVKLPAIGWTVVLASPGTAPIAAAPAPLRLIDAQALAAQIVASRAGEPELDRAGLANVLRRASHLAVALDTRLARFDLPRVVVGGRGARTVVVDAWAELL